MPEVGLTISLSVLVYELRTHYVPGPHVIRGGVELGRIVADTASSIHSFCDHVGDCAC